MGVTVVLLTCSYKGNEFVRVGFYVNNEYSDSELAENMPAKPIFEKVLIICQPTARNVFASDIFSSKISSLTYVNFLVAIAYMVVTRAKH